MATTNLGQIRLVTPGDDKKISEFNFIQAGAAGDIAVRFKGGEVTVISSGLSSRLSLIPVGVMDEVLSTGTTAGEIYVW
ncbi:hypothetical protein NVP1184A_04 [Vibrio phage 1.184.A._10N.286.49.A5]|nr:hypothetical protein NVP1184A_04 [Vibrio phage 1.184.A._10N.286.49.A5]